MVETSQKQVATVAKVAMATVSRTMSVSIAGIFVEKQQCCRYRRSKTWCFFLISTLHLIYDSLDVWLSPFFSIFVPRSVVLVSSFFPPSNTPLTSNFPLGFVAGAFVTWTTNCCSFLPLVASPALFVSICPIQHRRPPMFVLVCFLIVGRILNIPPSIFFSKFFGSCCFHVLRWIDAVWSMVETNPCRNTFRTNTIVFQLCWCGNRFHFQTIPWSQ